MLILGCGAVGHEERGRKSVSIKASRKATVLTVVSEIASVRNVLVLLDKVEITNLSLNILCYKVQK